MPSAPPAPVRASGGRTGAPFRRRAKAAAFLLAGLAVTLAGATVAAASAPVPRGRFDAVPSGPSPPGAARAPGGTHPILAAPGRAAAVPGAAAPFGRPVGARPPGHVAARGPVAASPPPTLQAAGAFPRSGPGVFAVAPGRGPVLGTAGRLRRFRVAVERGTPERLADFADAVDAVLGDPRGWVASRRVRLIRVPAGAPHEFTVYLATPATAGRMCATGGVNIRVGGEPFTSCRVGAAVVINLARWRLSTPSYVSNEIPLSVYRQYVINHEVGHALGNGHVRCPDAGRPAPVMMQQTLGLGGCRPNAWPYLNGRGYSGPPM